MLPQKRSSSQADNNECNDKKRFLSSKDDQENTTSPLSLVELCQINITKFLLENSKKQGGKLIQDLCQHVPLRLLEPIFTSILDSSWITEAYLKAYIMLPNRLEIKINQVGRIPYKKSDSTREGSNSESPALKILTQTIRPSVFSLIGRQCPNLIKLDLTGCLTVDNKAIRSVLQGCSQLDKLILDQCELLSDSIFDMTASPFCSLVGCITLTSLSMKQCPHITGQIGSFLSKQCRKLKYLNLSGCKNIKGKYLTYIFEAPSLESIDLSYIDGLGDEIFDVLSEKSQINDTLAKKIEILIPKTTANLKKISLNKSVITPAGVLKMITLFSSTLQEIDLSWCVNINDEAVKNISQDCKNLKVLSLQSCIISDKALEFIGVNCKNLRELDISWCLSITSSGLRGLLPLTNTLQSIGLVWCCRLQQGADANILDALKDMRVLSSIRLHDNNIIEPTHHEAVPID